MFAASQTREPQPQEFRMAVCSWFAISCVPVASKTHPPPRRTSPLRRLRCGSRLRFRAQLRRDFVQQILVRPAAHVSQPNFVFPKAIAGIADNERFALQSMRAASEFYNLDFHTIEAGRAFVSRDNT